ncbi:MAG: hypothetical protein ABIK83_08670 [Candidatus Zixiibacteriota bacterium]
MTNKELSTSRRQIGQQIAILDSQIDEVNRRLEKLYDALETGKIKLEQLTPRIRQHTERAEKLKRERIDLQESMQRENVQINRAQMLHYVDDLRLLLSESSIAEQRSFLKSFVKRIEIEPTELTLEYTLPLVSRLKAMSMPRLYVISEKRAY